LVHPDYQEWRG